MRATDTDTLVAEEERLMPLTILVVALSNILKVFLLTYSATPLPFLGWILLATPCVMISVINLRFLLGNRPSVGMIPVTVISLLPAAIAGAWAFEAGSFAWWCCILLAVFSFVVCIVFCWWFQRLHAASVSSEALEPNAVLIVLGGLIRNGVPVPTVANRLTVAAELWRESPERVIVLTGGATPDGLTTEAEAMSRWIQEREGVPEASILLETEAINTEQNISRSVKLLQDEGLSDRQMCIVSNDYHLYRALTIGRDYADGLVGVGARVPQRSVLQQWCREVLVVLVKRVW